MGEPLRPPLATGPSKTFDLGIFLLGWQSRFLAVKSVEPQRPELAFKTL